MIDSKRGSMPFALIAVTILLLASVTAAVVAERQATDDGTDDTAEGIEAIQGSIDDARTYINQELGTMILDISKDDSLGTLDRRATVFKERAESWIDERFPMNARGVRLELVEREFSLGAENMGNVNPEGTMDGYMPAYLQGTGKVTVKAGSQYGATTKEIGICTDGSYSLPLIAEQGSLFERMTEDGGISVSQMMTYELQSLAQYRVLNGYGSESRYGSKGTDRIITADDVEDAYRHAIDVIEAICFRDRDGELTDTRIDLADSMMDGYITFDRPAFYGQVLMSVLDDMVLKWFDYLCLGEFADALERKLGTFRLALDAIISFFTETDPFSAEGYIVKVMEEYGIDPAIYRHPGSGTTTVTVGEYTVTVDNPGSDVMSKGWIKQFKVHYHLGGNHIKDTMRQILNAAATKAIGRHVEPVTVHIDAHDEAAFVRTMADAFKGDLRSFGESLEGAVRDAMESEHFYDEFYAAIADTVMEHEGELMLSDELRSAIEESFRGLIEDEEELASVLGSEEIDRAIHGYESSVHNDLEVYDMLRYIDGGGPDLLSRILSQMASYGLWKIGVLTLFTDRSDRLMDEIVADMDVNPYSGIIDIPGTDRFQLVDEAGNRLTEKLDAELKVDLIAYEPRIIGSKCTHVTGLFEDSLAGYSTTFEVRVRDVIDYTVTGTGSFSEAMGSGITSSLRGSVSNDIVLDVCVASAWALAGVEYKASSTILSDAFQILCKVLEPIMEPLREIMAIVKEVIVALNECIMEVVRYVSDALTEMYERILGPLNVIAEWVQEYLDELIGDATLDLFYSLDLTDQSFGMEYMGYRFTLSFDLASLTNTVKTLVTASLEGTVAGMDLTASVSMKSRGELNPSNVFIIGKATVSSDDWKVNISMDPLLKGSRHLLTLSAEVGDIDISAVLPELDNYHEIGLRLSDIPGVGDMLDCIPIPVLGVNIGLDAGLSLKYSAPVTKGLMINEFESNPPGNDNGNEWVELLNNSDMPIDLEGYSLIASSDFRNRVMKLTGTIEPGQFLMIEPTFLMVNTGGKLTKNGEGLTLKDPDGNVVDKTRVLKDGSDDNNTWQRTYDGSGDWEFKEATMERSNGSFVSSKLMTPDVAKDIVFGAIRTAFDQVGSITDLDTMQQAIQITVKEAIESVIEKVAGCLVEASVFIKVDVMDPTASASGGVRVALRCDSELLEQTLKFIAGKVEAVAMSMKNPYRINGVTMFTENIDLEVTVDAKLQFPKTLVPESELLSKIDIGATFRTNISALTRLFGEDYGTPELVCGLKIIDCPTALVPAKLSPKSGMEHDLWLFKVTVSWL